MVNFQSIKSFMQNFGTNTNNMPIYNDSKNLLSDNVIISFSGSINKKSDAFVKSKDDIKMTNITDHEPKRVWQLFEEMTKIYRESGPSATNRENNKEISNYLVNKLKPLGFEVEQVQEGSGKYNIYASRNVKGNEDKAITLQGHMDIVCISDNKDPKKPIKLNIEGDTLKANNRTLGADNGIGLALAIAIAEKPEFKNIPLQLIFTVDEETGMYGAAAMKPDDIKGKFLLNIDSEKYGEITIGCAGMDTFVEKQKVPTETVNGDYKKIEFNIKGAYGGHSGEDINKGRMNPIREALAELLDTEGIKISRIVGGAKANAIPTDVKVEMYAKSENAQDISEKLKSNLEKTVQRYAKSQTDPKVSFELKIKDVEPDKKIEVLEPAFQQKLLENLGKNLLTGPRSTYDNGDTKTSQNIGILNLENGNIHLEVSMRSSDSKEKETLFKETTSQLSNLLDKEVKPFNSSPIWEPKSGSDLTSKAIEAYKELGVDNPRVYTCHGGLENAQFAAKRPDIDQISIGPDISDPHTTQESIQISSVKKVNDFIEQLLRKLS